MSGVNAAQMPPVNVGNGTRPGQPGFTTQGLGQVNPEVLAMLQEMLARERTQLALGRSDAGGMQSFTPDQGISTGWGMTAKEKWRARNKKRKGGMQAMPMPVRNKAKGNGEDLISSASGNTPVDVDIKGKRKKPKKMNKPGMQEL